jgi:hypothetical protein
MLGRPQTNEAAAYYSNYINRVTGDDVLGFMTTQLDETLSFLREISEEQSLQRYAPEKWSMRELLGHVNDTERVFAFRALWFARGFSDPLPSFDQEIAVTGSGAQNVSWKDLVEEFRVIRLATLALLRELPDDAWSRSGQASGNPVSVRALAYIMAGHVAHHVAILRERYL